MIKAFGVMKAKKITIAIFVDGIEPLFHDESPCFAGKG